ncbi:formylmethanofuran dehydrogenase subunit A [Tuwongella immobilis]|uniref:Amidohydrolase 3 domain-containing protein n=1 Tax=Tuwongella immobilis TaxID=692036 RepID=A0A6C2YNR4_9BACT|nr:formylmethanofuran dehydrogenase subunit A [Tuwongella immobilis]VIP02839.1 formylmethanofuran dehydrogenase subunit a : Formylmethanofuran dehydrogenase subunit A OS=Pirellula staleyi (strain ATCC 27377 / DSM 6068 / ICPB 4128) GN=Psta_0063 PE=4 SV=1: Amidohydro_3 [Tuwongella immobilis]VTS02605.1 formylmethanofuran dehydrogenase subunit a : Formylmethanofuran dehydrogenase subunit A OS=Pirellula staleyi (strain ATCC 27377 / DSM 6068 / ICPB 4128) GN=Psta_0063 PE=4 SV=1: Amidohydro_3 [Tuwongella
MGRLCIRNGTVFDPIHQVDGQVMDIWIENGKIIPKPDDGVASRVIDATGRIVMAGGIDMHAHIAGPKVNIARKLRPEDRRSGGFSERSAIRRSGTLGSTPSTFTTGYLYAGMGYTTVFDAAIPPLGARHTHEEFHDTPMIDKGFFVLIGNNHYAMQQIAKGESQRLQDFAGWLLNATRGYALKVVNPGGVENWKAGHTAHDTGLDTPVSGFDLTPRAIISAIAQVANDLKLPHPMHLHCNRLGLPGNVATTLDTMRTIDGRRAHLTHIQFHSYGGDPNDQATFCSGVTQLADYVNAHPEMTVDVGQVMFGETTSMTGDGPLGYYLHQVLGRKWFNGDTELEAGCGIVPITYRDKSFVHALQWAIGLEWYLLVKNPWQIALSTDHPNGAAFLAYPEIMHLLMRRDYRREVIARLPKKLRERCQLAELDREYSLYEIAIITRASPARMLGLPHKGHLGIGADADVTIYQPNDNLTLMFEMPVLLLKGGEIVVEHGELRQEIFGQTLVTEPSYDPEAIPAIRDWLESAYTIQFANYSVDDHYLPQGRVTVPCEGGLPRPAPAATLAIDGTPAAPDTP